MKKTETPAETTPKTDERPEASRKTLRTQVRAGALPPPRRLPGFCEDWTIEF